MLDHPGAVYRKVVRLPWEPWFAWRLVKIHGRSVWLQTVYRRTVQLPWEPWFAWRPVKIHRRRVWFQTVYRRTTLKYIDMDKWQHVEYGTLFDVIKDE